VAVKLSVNVDHVATVRQARRVGYPDPVEAARIALHAGAAGITAHLRVDRRHVQDDDLRRLREAVRGKLNVEMSTAEEMIAIALNVRPDQVTLVPERPEEVTTEGGLDLLTQGGRVAEVAGRLAEAGMAVSVFVDPDPRQIEALGRLRQGGAPIPGFEINTDAYTRATEENAARELHAVREAARLGSAAGLHVYAGHGLTVGNVGPVAAVPEMEELNIGHAIVSRAVLVGMAAAVEEMLAAIRGGQASA
jgi:pyridoxine 5-phosphate synthase